MAVYNEVVHHQNIRKRISIKHEPFPSHDKVKRAFDGVIYVAAFLAPIMHFPQLFKIWTSHNASGVSLISWASFSVFSLTWLIYGILHKEKPLIVMNSALMIIQALIAGGVVLYG